jgi:hypothetical protein
MIGHDNVSSHQPISVQYPRFPEKLMRFLPCKDRLPVLRAKSYEDNISGIEALACRQMHRALSLLALHS